MNFGQNIYNFLISNLQPLVLAGIGALAVYALVERKISKLIGIILLGIIAVGFVFATTQVQELFLKLFQSFFR